MQVYVAIFSENPGWGSRFDNEYRPVAMEVFKRKRDAVKWGETMKSSSRYHSSLSIITKEIK